MIEAIIIDDEKNAITTLKNDLQTYCPQVSVVAYFTQATEALAYLKINSPKVIFLDIDMPIMNGFDFLQAIEKPIRSQLIFVSAYSEFAIRAFKVSALDYLLKPVDPEELVAAVKKITTSDDKESSQDLLIKNFLDNYQVGNLKGKIALPVSDGYHLIDPETIIYCRADGAYTEIVTLGEKSFLISKTLSRTQELMPFNYFERVHQSYLINLNHIKKFKKGESPTAIMSNNDVIKVSRLNKDRLVMRLGI